MTDEPDITAKPWRRPVGARDPHEPHHARLGLSFLFPFAIAGVLAASYCPWPVPSIAVVLVTFLGIELWVADRRYRRQAVPATRALQET